MTKFTNSADSYGLVSKVIHWLIAIIIIALLVIGWIMVDLGYYDTWYHESLTWHKSLGIIVGMIVLIKLIWRVIAGAPRLQASLSSFEKFAAVTAHLILITAMIVIPITGFLISASEGAVVEVFNWFSVPAFIVLDADKRDIAIDIHYFFAYTTAGLVVLHIAAALKHQFIDGKGTLKRML